MVSETERHQVLNSVCVEQFKIVVFKFTIEGKCKKRIIRTMYESQQLAILRASDRG